VVNLPSEGKRPHLRGLKYDAFGRDIAVVSDYAKSIKRITKNFVLQYDLERAFSSNEKLLATVKNGKSTPFLAAINSDIDVLETRDDGAVPRIISIISEQNAKVPDDHDYGYEDDLSMDVPVAITDSNINVNCVLHHVREGDVVQLDQQLDQLRPAILSDIDDFETREDVAAELAQLDQQFDQMRRIDAMRPAILSDIDDFETREDVAAELEQLDQQFDQLRRIDAIRPAIRSDGDIQLDHKLNLLRPAIRSDIHDFETREDVAAQLAQLDQHATNITMGGDTKVNFDIYPDDDHGDEDLSMVDLLATTGLNVNAKFPDDDYGYDDGLVMTDVPVGTTSTGLNVNAKVLDDDYGYEDDLSMDAPVAIITDLNINVNYVSHRIRDGDVQLDQLQIHSDGDVHLDDCDVQLDHKLDQLCPAIRSDIDEFKTREDVAAELAQLDQLRRIDAIRPDIADCETREDVAAQLDQQLDKLRRFDAILSDAIRSDAIRSDTADLGTREDGAALLQLDQLRPRAVEIVRSETREDTEMTIDISYQDDDYGYDSSSQDSYHAGVTDLPLGEDTEMTIDISYQDDDYGYDSSQDSYHAGVTDLPLGEDAEMTIDISYQDDDYGYDPSSQGSYYADVSHLPRMKLRGQPALRNDLNVDMRRDIMRALWTYKVLICGDGTRPLRPWHKSVQEHYATCASMTALQSTIDITAFENSILSATDVVNAYAQSGRKPSDGYSTRTSIHSDQWNFAEVRIHMANYKLLQ